MTKVLVNFVQVQYSSLVFLPSVGLNTPVRILSLFVDTSGREDDRRCWKVRKMFRLISGCSIVFFLAAVVMLGTQSVYVLGLAVLVTAMHLRHMSDIYSVFRRKQL